MQEKELKMQNSTAGPVLGTTYEGRDTALLDHILPLVDFIEITPDSLAEYKDGHGVLPADAVAELKRLGSDTRLLVHGVGLSIGTYGGYSESYVQLLDALMDQVLPVWHSEHLGYVNVEGQHLGTMLAVSKTEQTLDMISERIVRIQERYGIPFAIENIVHVLPDYPGEYSDAGFLNALTKRTACDLILDIYNLECDAHNHGFNIQQFLSELEMRHVREIHVAGGVIHRGLQVDVHSRRTQDSTIALARQVIATAPNVETITYELLPEAVPRMGYDGLAMELKRLRQAILN